MVLLHPRHFEIDYISGLRLASHQWMDRIWPSRITLGSKDCIFVIVTILLKITWAYNNIHNYFLLVFLFLLIVLFLFLLLLFWTAQKHNFRKYSTSSINSLNVPYDYGSIMHYGKRDFSKFPYLLTTIKPKKSGVSIGQRKHLSALDVRQMNLYYECNKK